MVAQTQAQINFSGGGNLDKILEKLNKSVTAFSGNTVKATKGLKLINKETKTTSTVFGKLSTNIKSSADGFLSLSKNSRSAFGFFKDGGSNVLSFSEAIEETNSGVSGLALRFVGLKKEVTAVDNVLAGPAEHLADIADASDNTERAFVILSKISKPLRKSLKFLSEQAQTLSKLFLDLEKVVVKFVKKGIEIATKGIKFFADQFKSLSETVSKFGLIGKAAAKQFTNIGESLEKTTKKAETFNENLDPEKLERVDKAGQRLSGTFDKLSKGLTTAAAGVFLADNLGKAVRRFNDFRDSAEEAGEGLQEGFSQSGDILDRTGAKTQLLNNKLTATSSTASTLGGIFKNQLLTNIGALTAKTSNLIGQFQAFKIIATGINDAAIQASGLNDAFSQAQSLGIDTTAAEIAFQFGLVGEQYP